MMLRFGNIACRFSDPSDPFPAIVAWVKAFTRALAWFLQ
jgi:hypothetical protein